ncbi:hypothetical protein, partial [Helicobacter sp. 12S02634-8]|uniref:hypothetical protein n=1 Tax=Helicobacter sp. 12S02634-8 TaxID=1476199 RepID=UPI00117A89E3
MLEYAHKGEVMEIMPYHLDQSTYDAIHERFPDPRDTEIIVFTIEHILSHQSQVVIDTVNRKIKQIIYEVRCELIG